MRVLIIGGYGNFGSYIARSLAPEQGICLIIAGRSLKKAKAFADGLTAAILPEAGAFDIHGDVGAAFGDIAPDIVIHTTGPFQDQSHRVAEACIKAGAHYLDLADARNFVANILTLDDSAKQSDLLIVSGASSVPCLSAAFVDEAMPRFSKLEMLDYGITASHQTNRGLATASAILSYVGKPFSTLWKNRMRPVFGWQGIHLRRYPELGWRLFGNCDIPDLALFPNRYPTLHSQRFVAGHEVKLLHLGTWLLSWVVRLGALRSLSPYAERLLKLSFLFDFLGTGRSGFHLIMKGTGLNGMPREERVHLIARSGHGPYIPCMPAIILAKRMASRHEYRRGAMPCLDLIGLDEYLKALEGLDITVLRDIDDD